MRRALSVLTLLVLLPLGPARAEELVETHHVPTVDGAHIRVQVRRDPALDPQPVLLTYSPYWDDPVVGGRTGDDFLSRRYVPRGIARAWGDLLGTNGSSGCWDYGGAKEQQSGVDLVNYLADLPWSNGKVGMMGVSYDGTTANMVAVRGDDVPGLAAIVPIAAISRWYEYAYYAGARYNQLGTPPLFDFEIGRHPPPGDPVTDQHAREALLARTGECGAVEHTARAHEDSPRYDDFWLQRDYVKDASNIRVPVLLAHGWQDYNVKQQQSVHMWDAIPEDNPATAAREGVPFKIFYGYQAGHSYPHGDRWEPLLDAFLERTLLDVANGIENEPRYFSQPAGATDGSFVSATSFPPPSTGDVRLYLRAAGTLSLEQGDDPPIQYVDVERRFLRSATEAIAPGRLLYLSLPLAGSTRMVGSAVLDALIRSSNTRGQLDPILYDVDPDGSMTKIAPGMLNLRYRHGVTDPVDMPLLSATRGRVLIKPQDYVFGLGHRIAVVVQSSNSGEVIPDVPGVYTLHQSSSWLEIPVVDPPADPARLFIS